MNNNENRNKFRLNGKKIGIVVVLVIVLVGVVAYFAKGDGVVYAEAKANRQNIVTYYNYTGNIESDNTQTVLATSSQPVKKFYVDEKDVVNEGDILVEYKNDNLESSIVQAKASIEIAQVSYEKALGTAKTEKTVQAENALASAELSLKKAESNLERVNKLYENGASAKTELDEAQDSYDSASITRNAAQSDWDLLEANNSQDARTALAQLEQAKATLANYEIQLADSKIYAEVSGTVTEIYVSENEQIVQGTRIMDLVDYNNLKVDVKVDEYGLAAVNVGKEVDVYVNAYDLNISGTVSKISETATVENGVSYFPATITLEKNENLRVGMSVEVQVEKEKAADVIAIPVQAVNIADDKSAYVLVKDEAGKMINRPVVVGINDGLFVEIKSGLDESETFYFDSNSVAALLTSTSGGNAGGPPMGPGGGAAVRVYRN